MADNEASEKKSEPASQSKATVASGSAPTTEATDGLALPKPLSPTQAKPTSPSGTKSVLKITPKLGTTSFIPTRTDAVKTDLPSPLKPANESPLAPGMTKASPTAISSGTTNKPLPIGSASPTGAPAKPSLPATAPVAVPEAKAPKHDDSTCKVTPAAAAAPTTTKQAAPANPKPRVDVPKAQSVSSSVEKPAKPSPAVVKPDQVEMPPPTVKEITTKRPEVKTTADSADKKAAIPHKAAIAADEKKAATFADQLKSSPAIPKPQQKEPAKAEAGTPLAIVKATTAGPDTKTRRAEQVAKETQPPSSDSTAKPRENALANDASGDKAEVKVKMEEPVPGEETKESIRKRIWDYLEANNLANFPRPVNNRIPNFKGASQAGDKAATLEVFKKAQTVKINPDKPQERCRFLTLEANKTLLVPTPRLRQGLFNKINVPEDNHSKEMLKLCSTSQGIKEHSTPISLDSKVKVDLVIVGSVAVSRKGYRIGKGEGFADLEFGMMRTMEAVDDNIIIVSTVHESQIIDIPDKLKQEHDITVDFIVTQDEIIECPRHDKPKGIIWSILTKEKLNRVPILRKLRERQREAGIDVTLKDGEEPDASESNQDEQERPRHKDRRRRRRNTRNRDSEKGESEKGEGEGEKGEHSETGDGEKEGRRRERRNNRRRRRRSNRKSEGETGEDGTGPESGADGDKENAGDERRRRPQQRRRRRRSAKSHDGERSGEEDRGDNENESKPPREQKDRKRQSQGPLSTIYVGALPRSLRVSEFKAQVREKGINPLRVIWHGASGHAFLQFTKKDEADSALDTLKDMEIEGRSLKVEMSKRGVKPGSQCEHQINHDKEEAAQAAPEQ